MFRLWPRKAAAPPVVPARAEPRGKAPDGSLAAYGGIALVSASIGAVAVGAFAIGALALGRQMRRRRLERRSATALDAPEPRRLTDRA